MRSAESAEPACRANAPTWDEALEIVALPPHPVFVPSAAPEELKTVTWGVARAPDTPNWVRPGPTPRMSRVSEPVPPITKPAVRTLLPVPEKARVETLTRRVVGLAPSAS